MIDNPRFGDPKVFAWYDSLAERNLLQSNFSFELFTNADSRFPEQAGLLGETQMQRASLPRRSKSSGSSRPRARSGGSGRS